MFYFLQILAILCCSQHVFSRTSETRLDIVERLFRSEINLLRIDLQNERFKREMLGNRLDEVEKKIEKPAKEQHEHADDNVEHKEFKPTSNCTADVCTKNKLASILKGLQDEKRIKQAQLDAVSTRLLEFEQKLEDTRDYVDVIRQNLTNFKETLDTLKAEFAPGRAVLDGGKY